MKKMKRTRRNRIVLYLILLILLVLIIIFSLPKKVNKQEMVENLMIDLTNKSLSDSNKFIEQYNFNLHIEYEFNDNVLKDKIISQSIKKDSKIKNEQELELIVSLGKLDKEALKNDNINELGKVPIMMYHGIVNKKDSDTVYIGGNVDKDGYNRTTESFISDLEFYYQNGYRMIRLSDYVDGIINVDYGYSPIIITFDDGKENNIKVTGLDSEGNIIIDENCAVGILESFKKKYPDYNVTATFFVNGGLFSQPNYNNKILEWLVDNGYDIGNHTNNHDNLSNTSIEKTQQTIALVYQKLDAVIPNKYVNIIALPYGSPYNKNHNNFSYILNGEYDNYKYQTKATLRVGWEPEVSPFSKNFDKNYLKRCRAYDNNGSEFDIEMVFKNLEKNRYISDGYSDMITIPTSRADEIIETDKKLIKY